MDEIRTIRREIEDAANTIISAAERGLDLVDLAARGEKQAFEGLNAVLCAILQACAFQDITGQRLDRICPETLAVAKPRDPLLNGPADACAGLDQAAADRLFAEISAEN